jgi:hypothetical protein
MTHGDFDDLLALAAAGGLGPSEERRLSGHLEECSPCANDLEELQGLGLALRGLPTPQPSRSLLTRVREAVELDRATRSDERLNQALLAFLLFFSWATTAAGWVVAQIVSGEAVTLTNLFSPERWVWPVTYLGLAWLTGGAAVVILGLRYRTARRWV